MKTFLLLLALTASVMAWTESKEVKELKAKVQDQTVAMILMRDARNIAFWAQCDRENGILHNAPADPSPEKIRRFYLEDEDCFMEEDGVDYMGIYQFKKMKGGQCLDCPNAQK